MSDEHNQESALVPRLRFPEFREAGEWNEAKLGELITTVSPPAKLQSSSYLAKGDFPIIDQSQEFICGWTNDENSLITEPLPLIVFGDHTCSLKLVDRPFAQGADGIKILKANPSILTELLFYSLQHRPLVMEDYKRHFSILKERPVLFPAVESGEQQKIADCLSSLDELIAAQTNKLDGLKTHKKGLMQQLFPAEGETVPRLRFPEFREAGEWNECRLEDALRISATYGIVKAGEFQKEGIPMLRGGDIKDGRIGDRLPLVSTEIHSQYKRTILERNDVVIALVGYPGEAAVIPPHYVGANISRAVGLLRPKEGISADYLVGYLNSPIGRKTVLKPSAGSAQVVVNLAHLNDLVIPIPEANEQQKIADCLSALDDLIAAQGQKIELLKRHKKGLMQQLFPVLDEVPA